MTKLTKEHIKQLYKFTRQHYVEYYDVQTELVDHLANGIEAQWKDNPHVSFNTALNREFKKFGVFGFMEILEQKTKAMSKTYFKLLLKFAKEWFKLPKLAITISLFLAIQWSLSFGKYIFLAALLFILLISLVGIFNLKHRYIKRAKQQGKKWLLESIIFQTAGFNSMLFIVNIFNIINLTDIAVNNIYSYVISILITLVIVGSYISIVVFPKKADIILKKHYPEYDIV